MYGNGASGFKLRYHVTGNMSRQIEVMVKSVLKDWTVSQVQPDRQHRAFPHAYPKTDTDIFPS